jgi:cbb3-type cytochrome oxidase maturation protein
MYYPYFITYMLIGFVLSFFVFFWALNNGQFKDQKRARFLPLEDDGEERPVRASRVSRIELYALAFLACAGLMASAAVLVFALVRVNGS